MKARSIGLAVFAALGFSGSSAAQQTVTIVSHGQAAAAVVRQLPGGMTAVRDVVDPQDPVERFLLLAPTGPLVVQVSLFIDGQPFNAPREKLLDELLKLADSDGDGHPTWKEALDNPRFGFGAFRLPVVQPNTDAKLMRERLIAQYDGNKDGQADRLEMRQYMAQKTGGPAFSLGYGSASAGKPALADLLDTDRDHSLSSAELAAASETIAARDADANELVTAAELGIEPVATNLRVAATQPGRGTQNLHLLGPAGQLNAVFDALAQQYSGGQADLPLWPRLAALDTNQNGKFDRSEAAGLNSLEPHITLVARVGQVEANQKRLEVTAVLPPEHVELSAGGESAVIELPGLKIDISVRPAAYAANNKAQAAVTLARLDSDKNNYLERSEVARSGQIFEELDENGDGKVYAAEIESVLDRQAAQRGSQISATATTDRDPLLTVLDTSGDQRIGLRELRAAAVRLAALDKNADGVVALQEVPQQLSLALTHGGGQFFGGNVVVARLGNAPTEPARPLPGAPEWFTRMDRNGDGDLSLREFLGTPEQFQRLDADADGLIDVKEAQSVAK